jgi:hypothetical protein
MQRNLPKSGKRLNQKLLDYGTDPFSDSTASRMYQTFCVAVLPLNIFVSSNARELRLWRDGIAPRPEDSGLSAAA